ncbi:MAG: hypothetical protein R2800_14615 [Flavipsychrobacter sp.]
MKKTLLALLLVVTALSSFAQYGRRGGSECPKVYLGLSTGLNNTNGLLGINLDVPISPSFSLGAGGGLSTWGWKAFFEGRYYFGQECNRGWAIGTGLTYNTGLSGSLEVDQDPEGLGIPPARVTIEPVPAAFLSMYRFFNIGQRGNRFYLQLGWSQRFNDKPYSSSPFQPLTSDGETVMRILSPGGVIFGVGFSFGIVR